MNHTNDYINDVNLKTSNMFDKTSFLVKNTNSDIADATGDESLRSPNLGRKKSQGEFKDQIEEPHIKIVSHRS